MVYVKNNLLNKEERNGLKLLKLLKLKSKFESLSGKWWSTFSKVSLLFLTGKIVDAISFLCYLNESIPSAWSVLIRKIVPWLSTVQILFSSLCANWMSTQPVMFMWVILTVTDIFTIFNEQWFILTQPWESQVERLKLKVLILLWNVDLKAMFLVFFFILD